MVKKAGRGDGAAEAAFVFLIQMKRIVTARGHALHTDHALPFVIHQCDRVRLAQKLYCSSVQIDLAVRKYRDVRLLARHRTWFVFKSLKIVFHRSTFRSVCRIGYCIIYAIPNATTISVWTIKSPTCTTAGNAITGITVKGPEAWIGRVGQAGFSFLDAKKWFYSLSKWFVLSTNWYVIILKTHVLSRHSPLVTL